jgi:DNA-binding SARP family transcriptional activator
MRVGILGPLTVEGDDGPVDVGGARLRALLIRLAIDVGRTVDSERLADALWGDHPRRTRPTPCSRWFPGCAGCYPTAT